MCEEQAMVTKSVSVNATFHRHCCVIRRRGSLLVQKAWHGNQNETLVTPLHAYAPRHMHPLIYPASLSEAHATLDDQVYRCGHSRGTRAVRGAWKEMHICSDLDVFQACAWRDPSFETLRTWLVQCICPASFARRRASRYGASSLKSAGHSDSSTEQHGTKHALDDSKQCRIGRINYSVKPLNPMQVGEAYTAGIGNTMGCSMLQLAAASESV